MADSGTFSWKKRLERLFNIFIIVGKCAPAVVFDECMRIFVPSD